MGLEAEKTQGATERLIAAGRVLLAQGDTRFSLTRLCAEAGVTLEEFRASFASKAALLQQLMEPEKAEPPQADPWLERRLRVFERALGTLEEKSEKRDRDYRQTIARLEERLAALSGTQLKLDVAAAAEHAAEPEAVAAPQAQDASAPQEEAAAPEAAESEAAAEPQAEPRALAPLEPMGPPARADSEFLEAGRRAAQAHARELARQPKQRPDTRRLLLSAALAVVTLMFCAVLALGHAGLARPIPAGEGTAHRQSALTPMQRLVARADSGDGIAARELALSYLRGQGVAKDMAAAARWAEAAAGEGDAEAQYLAGCLTRDGAGVTRDAARAFAWFAKAAAAGQVKAMHNLAIAYIQGEGTMRDEAAAAAWFARAAAGGHMDAAFDLGVLYEKGQGVAQDARTALHWYRVAAAQGDGEAAIRARRLAEQTRL